MGEGCLLDKPHALLMMWLPWPAWESAPGSLVESFRTGSVRIPPALVSWSINTSLSHFLCHVHRDCKDCVISCQWNVLGHCSLGHPKLNCGCCFISGSAEPLLPLEKDWFILQLMTWGSLEAHFVHPLLGFLKALEKLENPQSF